jgi:hypothetical protein
VTRITPFLILMLVLFCVVFGLGFAGQLLQHYFGATP